MCNVWMMRECWEAQCDGVSLCPVWGRTQGKLAQPDQTYVAFGTARHCGSSRSLSHVGGTARQTVWHKRSLVSYVISVVVVAGTGGLIRQRNDARIRRRVRVFFSFPSSSPPPPLSVSPVCLSYPAAAPLSRLFPLWLSVLRVAVPECPGAVVPPALQWRMSGPDALWLEAPPARPHSSLSSLSLSSLSDNSSQPARALLPDVPARLAYAFMRAYTCARQRVNECALTGEWVIQQEHHPAAPPFLLNSWPPRPPCAAADSELSASFPHRARLSTCVLFDWEGAHASFQYLLFFLLVYAGSGGVIEPRDLDGKPYRRASVRICLCIFVFEMRGSDCKPCYC